MKKAAFWILVLFMIAKPAQVEAGQVKLDTAVIESFTNEIGDMYGFCPEFLQAVIEKESSNIPDAVNGECVGLMQINPKWHEDRMQRLGVTDLMDPFSNILVGTDYLSELYAESVEKGYGDDMYYVLMRYNMKCSTVNSLWESMEFSEYAMSVADRAAELEIEHGK